MIKDLLQNISPSLTDQLPHGTINVLAEKHEKSRQRIAMKLRGDNGSEENVGAVLKSAIEILRRDADRQQQLAGQLEGILGQSLTAA